MLKQQVENFIRQRELFKANNKILLAISGGIDSMVMLDILHQLNYTIVIAHCNFNLRADESDLDEKFVRDYAHRNDIPLFVAHFDTKEFAQKKNITTQEAARNLRYDWFYKTLNENEIDFIATAHNADDVAETLLINIGRGCGISGFHGIPVVNNKVVRPILFASRNEIEEYARKNRILFRYDSSNSEHKYTRNKIRHEIIPILKKIFPEFIQTVTKTTELVAKQEEIYNSKISDHSAFISFAEEVTEIDIIALSKINYPEIVLFEIVKKFGFSFSQVQNMIDISIHKSGNKFISDTHIAISHGGKLIIKKNEVDEDSKEFLINDLSGFSDLPIKLSCEILDKNQFPDIIVAGNSEIFLDASKIIFPLKLRHWHFGDAFYPSGLNGSKKLQDYFGDLKLNLFQKKSIWILESNHKIVWIVGHRADKRFFVTDMTEQIVKISVI